MKKIVCAFGLIFLFLLVGCSGSDTYAGVWKATDKEGAKFDVTFNKNTFEVKNENSEISSFNYTQNSVKISNGVKSYERICF